MLKSKIKVKLAELDISQIELSERLGVTKQTINAWVRGRACPTLEMAFKIAKELNCRVDDLYTYEED